ncbi:bifunctional phosphoglucose/phosphomannose isomerase [Dehalococcoides mccartyi]|uniref:Bifunctional phosphoglucose/phosphomannose isomerase n=1 Tax=Dehalococcoides mccartyi TaxID=61435 RepID=A0A2J1DY95_9CHLR|nr:bifunctional phosphoglucose/phosphomannose isomerase [Dehalococcoides mccartyi]
MDIINLDDLNMYEKLDPHHMLDELKRMPLLCKQSWETAEALSLPEDYRTIKQVVILGMGTSGVGAQLAERIVRDECKIPIYLHQDYLLPAYVSADTLVIASSSSGSTEEVVSCFNQALNRHAKLLVLTTGGQLKETATAHNIPGLIYDYTYRPSTAIAYGVLPILSILHQLGFIPNKSAEVSESLIVLSQIAERLSEKHQTTNNSAKQLAGKLEGRAVMAFGSGVTFPAARRFKTQLNENAKCFSFAEEIPEMNHNSVVGYELPRSSGRYWAAVMFKTTYLSKRIHQRMRITTDMLHLAKIPVFSIDGYGFSPLCQTLSLILQGDFVSLYLAFLTGVDPYPIDAVDYFKRKLAES